MDESPLMILLVVAASLYVAKIWFGDYRAQLVGNPNANAFPGAFPASQSIILIAIMGAVILVGIESAGEYALGVSAEQSNMKIIALLAIVAAGFFEELVFRGYLVVTGKGKAALIASIIGFSLIFTLLHTKYYLNFPEDAPFYVFSFDISMKSGWTLLILFLNSLWFYGMRFNKWNPQRSLLPCFAAHIASNLAVFVVKAAQGHVSGLY